MFLNNQRTKQPDIRDSKLSVLMVAPGHALVVQAARNCFPRQIRMVTSVRQDDERLSGYHSPSYYINYKTLCSLSDGFDHRTLCNISSVSFEPSIMAKSTNAILETFSNFTVVLNRILAWVDFVVHYTSGYVLYYCFGGIKPQYHTRPKKTSGGGYSPSVVITGSSQGKPSASSLQAFGDY